MSDETIRVGDLVMVVRGQPCCGKTLRFGYTYVATEVRISRTDGCCVFCGAFCKRGLVVFDGEKGFYIQMLKKINPPSADESMQTEREVAS